MSWFTDAVDSFSGGGGSQAQGTATTAGAGDGAKGDQINSWLNRVTGVYSSLVGRGTNATGATTPNVPAPKTPWLLYAAVAAGASLLLWLVFKKGK